MKTGIQPDVPAARQRAGRTAWRWDFKYQARETVDLNQTNLLKRSFLTFFLNGFLHIINMVNAIINFNNIN
jgi:hypothetical protein